MEARIEVQNTKVSWKKNGALVDWRIKNEGRSTRTIQYPVKEPEKISDIDVF